MNTTLKNHLAAKNASRSIMDAIDKGIHPDISLRNNLLNNLPKQNNKANSWISNACSGNLVSAIEFHKFFLPDYDWLIAGKDNRAAVMPPKDSKISHVAFKGNTHSTALLVCDLFIINQIMNIYIERARGNVKEKI